MLDGVVKLTYKDTTRVFPDDHVRLRGAGYDDRGLLQVTLIVAWFNNITRVADARGVGREGKKLRPDSTTTLEPLSGRLDACRALPCFEETRRCEP